MRVAESSRGRLTLICGCMFSGKTTELLRRTSAYSPLSVVVLKHVIDRRYRLDAVVSHGGLVRPAFRIASAGQITRYVHGRTRLVALDEGHFFNATLVRVARDLIGRGMDVIITSLDRDSWGRAFNVADRLRTMADEPLAKYAVCARCGAVADRTQRLTPIVAGNMVGGPESYEARCRSCWAPPPETPPNDSHAGRVVGCNA